MESCDIGVLLDISSVVDLYRLRRSRRVEISTATSSSAATAAIKNKKNGRSD